MSTLVTGAGGAIGSAIVAILREAGEEVVAQDLNPDAIAAGPGVVASGGDLRLAPDLEELAGLCRERRVDRVIAAHGVEGVGSLAELDERRASFVFEVNATSVVRLLEALLPDLRPAAGVFVVVSSQAGFQGEPNLAAYCAAKYAVVGWARALAPGLAVERIRLRVLCPGCTDTPLLQAAFERFGAAAGADRERALSRRLETIPVGRLASARETAAAAVYLADRGPRPTVLGATGGEVQI